MRDDSFNILQIDSKKMFDSWISKCSAVFYIRV